VRPWLGPGTPRRPLAAPGSVPGAAPMPPSAPPLPPSAPPLKGMRLGAAGDRGAFRRGPEGGGAVPVADAHAEGGAGALDGRKGKEEGSVAGMRGDIIGEIENRSSHLLAVSPLAHSAGHAQEGSWKLEPVLALQRES